MLFSLAGTAAAISIQCFLNAFCKYFRQCYQILPLLFLCSYSPTHFLTGIKGHIHSLPPILKIIIKQHEQTKWHTKSACLTNTSHSRIQQQTSPTKPSKKRAPSRPITITINPPQTTPPVPTESTNHSILDYLQLTSSSFTETASYLWCSTSTKNFPLSVTISNAYLAYPCCRGSDHTRSILRGCWTRLRIDGLNLGAALRTGEGEGRDRSLGCGEGVMWIVPAPMRINLASSSSMCVFRQGNGTSGLGQRRLHYQNFTNVFHKYPWRVIHIQSGCYTRSLLQILKNAQHILLFLLPAMIS